MSRWLLAACLAFALGCGVKAAPQPPGVTPAKRGDPPKDCPGCELPAPDSLPTPAAGDGIPEEEVPGLEGEDGEEGASGGADEEVPILR